MILEESFKEQEKNCIVVDGDQGLCLGAGPLAGQGQCHLMLLMKESFNGVPACIGKAYKLSLYLPGIALTKILRGTILREKECYGE